MRDAGGVLGGMSLVQANGATKGSEGSIRAAEDAKIVPRVPQLASLLSPIADSPFPTSLVLKFSLYWGQGHRAEPIFVLQPSLVSRVDVPNLTPPAASKHTQNGGNENYVMVLPIRPQFWWIVGFGLKYHHTKMEEKTQPWRPVKDVVGGGPYFQKISKMAQKKLRAFESEPTWMMNNHL